MTNTQLKSQVDLEITNKTENNSVTPLNVGKNIKDVVDYVDQEIADITLTPGPTGPAGPTGAQGIAGPVGPAGLEWQGAWVSGTSYVVDDAVGYNGASWFCVNATSGTTSPNLDPINWALLAAQGSPGPQGAQGIQGPAGNVAELTTQNIGSNTNSAPFPVASSNINMLVSTNFSYALPADPTLGQVIYVRTVGGCVLYASPDPGNDGASNNFFTPQGNGNININLLAQKIYRFTYIGKFGSVYGFWTIEIMNNI